MKPIVRAFALSLVLSAVPAFSEISFLDPDINNANDVLFTVRADIPGRETCKTLFMKRVGAQTIEQLSFYPEAMESLLDGTVLQVRNRFGTARWDTAMSSFSWVNDAKPFRSGGSIGFGALRDVAASPDGHWMVFIDPVSPTRGRLSLYDVVKDARYVLAPSVERGGVPVSWSPDSSILLYSIDGTIYFSRPQSLFTVDSVDARYRVLGSGSIANVSWFSDSRFLYVSGSSVYRAQASELLARSLYSPLIGIGELAGKLPCDFDPAFDSFCSSPDGTAILLSKGSRNVYYCPLSGDDYVLDAVPSHFPWLLLSGNTSNVIPLWTANGIPAVFAESIQDGARTFRAWKAVAGASGTLFAPMQIPSGTKSFVASPDGNYVAFLSGAAVQVYGTANWKEIASFQDERVVAASWGKDTTLFLGGVSSVRSWDFKVGASSILFLSSVSSAGWDEQGTVVLADSGSLGRFKWEGSMKWSPSTVTRIRPAMAANASWRLYTDSGKGYYANMLYARSATSPGGTAPFVSEPSIKLDSVTGSAKDPAVENSVFSHGSRTGFRQVALVFDAMDSLDGLPVILDVLDRYKIHATFFINGEFIREHPAAVNEIVKAGHQSASLFFTTWDLSGTQYRIDKDFIVRGLSRNEDDFYDATGQELTLLWHAPYYVSSSDIVAAGASSGYRYISPDINVPDWVSLAQAKSMPGLYKASADIVEDIVSAKKPGSIIPVRIGKLTGGRNDYLWSKIDLLVNALVEAGYGIVTVDTLIQNAR
jgi:peptidoglycan/xylan/chitin deacetylase (PgdA/CDA1 family)